MMARLRLRCKDLSSPVGAQVRGASPLHQNESAEVLMPPGLLPLEDTWVCPTWKKTLGETQNSLKGLYIHHVWPGRHANPSYQKPFGFYFTIKQLFY